MTWVLLGVAIASEVSATMALRASGGLRRKRWVPAVVGGYLCAFTFLALALERGLSVGVAYGIWAACGVILTAVAARWLFAERLTPAMALGIALTAVGVVLVELGARSS